MCRCRCRWWWRRGESKAHDVRRVQAAAGHLPQSRVVVLPGVSRHTMPVTRAADLNKLVTDFLNAA